MDRSIYIYINTKNKRRIYGEASADAHFGLLGRHQCCIAEKNKMRSPKIGEKLQTVSTTDRQQQKKNKKRICVEVLCAAVNAYFGHFISAA